MIQFIVELKKHCKEYKLQFNSMHQKVEDHIDNCLICLLANISRHIKKGELIETPIVLFEVVHIDHFSSIILSIDLNTF